MMKLFSSRSGSEEGGRKLLLGLELKNFAADSNFSEKKKWHFCCDWSRTLPDRNDQQNTVKYMADKSSVLYISLTDKILDSTCSKRSQISVLYFSYKVSCFQRSPLARHRRVLHKGHSSPMACKLLLHPFLVTWAWGACVERDLAGHCCTIPRQKFLLNKYTFAIEFLDDNFTLSCQNRRIWHIKNQHPNNYWFLKRYK